MYDGKSNAGSQQAHHIHRWYEPGTARYNRADPLGLVDGGPHLYAYALPNPLVATDPLGLVAKVCCRLLNSMIFGNLARQRHCYVKADDGTVYGLYPEGQNGNEVGVPRTNDPRDKGGRCKERECEPGGTGTQNQCFRDAHNNYPVGEYNPLLGPNSNTYAGTLARECCKGGIPDGLGSAPGLKGDPPKAAPPPRKP